MTFGEYQVVGKREYRGHAPGTIFEARLDRNAAARAIRRGDIALLRTITPGLEPGSFSFPVGWLASPIDQSTEAPKGASLVERGKSQ